jgi:hypothetical protein
MRTRLRTIVLQGSVPGIDLHYVIIQFVWLCTGILLPGTSLSLSHR